MKIHDATNIDLKTLTNALDEPFDVVTTDAVDDARAMVARTVTDNHEIELFWAMLGIDDTGRAEGIARGQWTETGA